MAVLWTVAHFSAFTCEVVVSPLHRMLCTDVAFLKRGPVPQVASLGPLIDGEWHGLAVETRYFT